MRPKNANLILSAAFFICFIFFIKSATAQQGSIYFSVGDNKAWYSPSTIQISQNQLGNSYDLLHVKADNKTHTAVSALQLNYRLGYYCNYEQTLGLEFNFDPVHYGITDGEEVTLKGMVNGIPKVHKIVVFSAKNGYFYQFDGANLMLLNIVRRIGLYHTNNRKLSFDVVLKGGVGPVMPHVQNSLPIDAADDPVLEWGGWNVGYETALRASIYRYGYVELAGKYDYASLSSIKVYDGIASQHLNTYEAILSIGLTLPTTHYNPLFYRQNIITVIPLFVDKQERDEQEASQDSLLNVNTRPLTDIPEFPEIVEKNLKKIFDDSMANAVKRFNDSVAAQFAANMYNDSIAAAKHKDDSLIPGNKNIDNDSLINKGGTENLDSLENMMLRQAYAPASVPKTEQISLTTKEKKKLEKKERRERKKREKQQKKGGKKKGQEEKNATKQAADNPVKKVTENTGAADSTGK